jgi:ubiquinone/menaquinone biosynthesis C-methylase UbiE
MSTTSHTVPGHDVRLWNRFARGYAKRPVADQAAYEYKLDETAKYLQPQDRVLEFGCGTGSTALIHAHRVAHIDAIDFSSAMIEIAKEKRQAQGAANVTFHVSAFEDWPVPAADDGYDVIMVHSVLHLVRDLDTTLDRVRRCLKPGGIFVSSTACIRDMGGLVARVLPHLAFTGLIPKVLPLTGNGLISQMQAHGFEICHQWRPGPDQAIFIIARAPGGDR